MLFQKDSFLRFIELILLKNTVVTEKVILTLGNNTLKASVVNQGHTFAFMGELTLDELNNDIESVGVDLKKVLSFADTFPMQFEMTREKNKLVFTAPNFTAGFVLSSTEYIKNIWLEDDFNKVIEKTKDLPKVQLTKEQIKKIVNYANTVGNEDISIEGKDNKISFKLAKSENFIQSTLEAACVLDNFKIRMPIMLTDVFSTIGDDLILSIKNNAPILISYKNKNINFNYFIAKLKD